MEYKDREEVEPIEKRTKEYYPSGMCVEESKFVVEVNEKNEANVRWVEICPVCKTEHRIYK